MANELKIIGLKCDGVRLLSAIEMRFKDKGLIPIKGKNKQGKTSIIDTIQWMISGNKTLSKSAINFNKDKAEAELQLGPYKIKRVITDKSAKLEVRNTETNEVQSGEVQNFLNTFINELTFNPRALANLTKVEKYKFCMDLYKIDFTAIDRESAALEQDRLLTGREVKKFGDLDINEPEAFAEVDLEKLLAEKKAIEDRNQVLRAKVEAEKDKQLKEIEAYNKLQREKARMLEVEQDRNTDLINDLTFNDAEIEKLQIKLAELKELREKTLDNLMDSNEKLSSLPQPEPEKALSTLTATPDYEDTVILDNQIQNSLLTNKKAEIYKAHLAKKAEKANKQAEYDALDNKIKTLREKKLEILRSVDTKVKGLSIGEDDIYYNGVGSENWSDSERMRITSEMAIAMMPNLRAIFIDGLESMDKEAREDLARWAEASDIQVIATIVSDSPVEDGEDCFYIVNGQVKIIDDSYEVVDD